MDRLRTILKLLILLLVASACVAAPTDELVVEHLFDLYELDTAVYEVDVLSNPLKSKGLSPGELSIRPLTRDEPLGLFTVKATVTRDGREVETGQVRMRVKKYAEVLVLADRIGRSDEVTANQVTLDRREVTDLREMAITDKSDLGGMRARRNLRKGEILTSGDLEPIPDIESGHDVTIVYAEGLCRVTVPGRAMQDGCTGETIKVRNEASRKVIFARVVDGSRVAVEP